MSRLATAIAALLIVITGGGDPGKGREERA